MRHEMPLFFLSLEPGPGTCLSQETLYRSIFCTAPWGPPGMATQALPAYRQCSPLDDPGKKKFRCTPRGTKVVIYHLVGNFMLNSMQNVVSLATCAESL